MAAVAKHTLLEDGSHEATDFDSAEASMSQVSRGWSKIKKVALVLAVASLAVSAILISQHFKVKPAFDTDAPVIVEDPAVVEELWDNCAICANCNGQKCNVAAHGGGCWCVCGHKHLGTSECSSTPSGPYNAQGPSWGNHACSGYARQACMDYSGTHCNPDPASTKCVCQHGNLWIQPSQCR